MDEVQRVHIVGGAGSGKTTLARLLGERLGVPVYDLDAIGYAGGSGTKRPLQTKLDDVQRIATQPGWVTEGVFLWWSEELLRHADAIVWLDLPFRVTAWRICLRHVKAELVRNNQHPGWRKLGRFLWSVWRYHASNSIQPQALDDDAMVTREATAIALQPFGMKVLMCRRRAEVRSLTC